jgi:hypothetical protein
MAEIVATLVLWINFLYDAPLPQNAPPPISSICGKTCKTVRFCR